MNPSSPPGIDAPTLAELRQTPGRISAWLFPIASPSRDKPDLGRLSPDEQERARRFHFDRDRTRFILARSGMRTILGACLGVAAGQIRFRYGTRGKPELAEPSCGLHFNLSHSGDWALFGIAGAPIGVDLEQIESRVKVTELAQRFFSVEDRTWLLAQPEALRLRAFFRLWVTREAWLKATGDGLSLPLDQLVTEWTGDSITALRDRAANRRGAVLELASLPPNYCAAAATGQASPQLTLTCLPML